MDRRSFIKTALNGGLGAGLLSSAISETKTEKTHTNQHIAYFSQQWYDGFGYGIHYFESKKLGFHARMLDNSIKLATHIVHDSNNDNLPKDAIYLGPIEYIYCTSHYSDNTLNGIIYWKEDGTDVFVPTGAPSHWSLS